jgi:hypothetical protein
MSHPQPKYKLNDTVVHEAMPGIQLTIISTPKWFDGGWHYILTSIGRPVPEELLLSVEGKV